MTLKERLDTRVFYSPESHPRASCEFTVTEIHERGRAAAQAVFTNQDRITVLQGMITGVIPETQEKRLWNPWWPKEILRIRWPERFRAAATLLCDVCGSILDRDLNIMAHSVILSLRDVTVTRGNRTILDSISWQVKQGEHWVILGANGSGKTSLLNTLTAYLTISQGEFVLFGYKYGTTDWRELRKKIGLISDSILHKIHSDETCIRTVASGKHAMINYWGTIPKEETHKVLAILRKIECEHLADSRWGHLSQGEKQRILIGRALMADLNLLVLDEPCAGLDPVARENFLAFLSKLTHKNDGLALLFVTHHIEEITDVFSHVLMLKDGKILAAGKKEEVLNSATLSKAFDTNMELRKNKSRYSLITKSKKDTVL